MQYKKPLFWDEKKISIFSILLLPFSIIYLILFWILKITSSFKKYNNSLHSICVGNIYLGGTGKTPLAIEIYKFLKSKGKKPSFIKKNYDFLIDEINMLRAIGDTFCAKDRPTAIKLSKLNGNDIAILDDGFQDFSVKPNFSILCFNSKQIIGNGFVIPSGPLREGLNAINRADCIVINGEKTKDVLKFEEKIFKKFNKRKLHLFYSNYKIKDVEKIRNKEVVAFAGIGNPTNFFELLKENKINIKKSFSFPDHHSYSQKDFDKITSDKSTRIVTTKKDYFRLNDQQKQICDYIEINLVIENRDKLEKLIESNL